ncbi:antagonist of SinR [Robertmurraya andreesenii]|uniref:Antagonist of SinR n=1 Tax=Anoxybacillus andreesenii TaxID=1325932 RepID=A0ABT9V3N1_9BACL|nr:antagonist of SinR [Robertmurraya andreesenii]
MIEAKGCVEGLDTEWVKLILEAKRLGISKEEIREFLNSNSYKQASS